MPEKMERELKSRVRKMQRQGKKVDPGAYIFGTMKKIEKAMAKKKAKKRKKAQPGKAIAMMMGKKK